jgi:hypothetical protein
MTQLWNPDEVMDLQEETYKIVNKVIKLINAHHDGHGSPWALSLLLSVTDNLLISGMLSVDRSMEETLHELDKWMKHCRQGLIEEYQDRNKQESQ